MNWWSYAHQSPNTPKHTQRKQQSQAPNVLISDGSMRNDGGINDIQVAYRLRSYNTTATSGNGEGTFYIEGIVSRGETVMARALLRRSLYVSSKVARCRRLECNERPQSPLKRH